MDLIYLQDYLLFTFFASFGVLQIALSKKASALQSLGILIVFLSYLWFFGSKNRNAPTFVEGTQLLIVFSVSTLLAIAVTKIFILTTRKNEPE